MSANSCIVISRLPDIDLCRDFVALPSSYGTSAYFARPDVQAIQQLVEENLASLDSRIHFTPHLHNRLVIIKPNLVTVYSRMGLQERDYPETTDPRLLDALVVFFQRYGARIVIAESSGRGVPTRGSFHVAGLHRLARYRRVQLVALEEQPVHRYYLPDAAVQKEILVPAPFDQVVTGQAFYVSVPKLKTNLYTGVTLGFKNAMGVLPYNLRQRDHNFALEKKLVDILALIQPDLTVIDGLIGGQGNCPAPVDPVDSRIIISGNNVVETDRVAARLMGFDPSTIPLICIADAAGFGDPSVEILGQPIVTPFRPADPSLTSSEFRRLFPNVRVLLGHHFTGLPQPVPGHSLTPRLIHAQHSACRGGCLASTRFAFEMFLREGQSRDFSLTIIIGGGLLIDGTLHYLDADGRVFTLDHVRSLPGRKLVIGTCAHLLASSADRFVDGCMPFPNAPHAALHALTQTRCTVMSFRNHHLIPLLVATLQMSRARKRFYRRGLRLDVPLGTTESADPPPLPSNAPIHPIIPWPLPPFTPEEARQACRQEDRAILATFTG